jgi:hypothetical protein
LILRLDYLESHHEPGYRMIYNLTLPQTRISARLAARCSL